MKSKRTHTDTRGVHSTKITGRMILQNLRGKLTTIKKKKKKNVRTSVVRQTQPPSRGSRRRTLLVSSLYFLPFLSLPGTLKTSRRLRKSEKIREKQTGKNIESLSHFLLSLSKSPLVASSRKLEAKRERVAKLNMNNNETSGLLVFNTCSHIWDTSGCTCAPVCSPCPLNGHNYRPQRYWTILMAVARRASWPSLTSTTKSAWWHLSPRTLRTERSRQTI